MKQEIFAEIAALKHRINRLEKMFNPPNKRWRAEKGYGYYYITARGLVEAKTEAGLDLDNSRYEFGNYFQTREQAEFEVERLKVIAELREFATPISEFDWTDTNQNKCMLSLDVYGLEINTYYTYQSSDLVFESEEVARDAIEAVGEERIIKYYFRRGENNADNN